MAGGVNATPSTPPSTNTPGGGGEGGSPPSFEASLARIEAAGLKRIEQEATATESKENIGANKAVVRATSA